MSSQEIEIKLFVSSLAEVEQRLLQNQARLVQERSHELNQRFDQADGKLRKERRVLRLRDDGEIHLTYKAASTASQGVLTRTELEVTVSDMGTARRILEALGYVQIALYEKYRRVYELDGCQVMLDELPFGDFVEIEGPDQDSILKLSRKLGLNPERAARGSYLGIYERYCKERILSPEMLTFEALQGIHPPAEDLGLQFADRT